MATLVTGGLGFVGSHFVWAADRSHRDVVVLDDGSSGANPQLPLRVKVVRGDIGDGALIRDVADQFRIDDIVHFAGVIQVAESVKSPSLYFDINCVRALRLLENARDLGVERLVFSSSAAVYGEPRQVPIPESALKEPTSPYGASKLAFEHVLEAFRIAYGIRFAALRYFNAAGANPSGKLRESHEPETHLIPLVIDAALGRRPPVKIFGADYPTPDGTCVRDYIHVEDLAAAHLAALDRLARGESLGAVNLGTGVGTSVRQIIDSTQRGLGREVPCEAAPRRSGDPSVLVADPRLARGRLDWIPARSDIDTIIEDTIRSRR